MKRLFFLLRVAQEPRGCFSPALEPQQSRQNALEFSLVTARVSFPFVELPLMIEEISHLLDWPWGR